MLYIFDMGGVVTTTASVVPKICAILGMSESEFYSFCGCPGGNASYGDPSSLTAYDASATDLLTLCSDGAIQSGEFWRMFSVRSGKAVTTDWWHWLFHPQLNEKTVELVKRLRSAGHRVVCGTNTMDSHYHNHLERGDYAFFDQTYASFLMGVSKPNPEFWRIILRAEDALPEETVFIDDKKVNCEGAQSLGIKAVQFSTAEAVARELGLSL